MLNCRFSLSLGLSVILLVVGVQASEIRNHLHSHNDYQQRHPLADAMAVGLRSFEADLWLSQGEIKVSHWPFFYKGKLEDLYLKPLQRLVDERTSVYGDHQTVILWLDLKESNKALRVRLAEILRSYSMIRIRQDGFIPVQVVLTGNERSKELFISEYPELSVWIDSRELKLKNQVAKRSWCSLEWGQHFSWEDEAEWTAQQKAELRDLVYQVHKQGRRLRFYNQPVNEHAIRNMLEAGVDLVGVDNLKALPARVRP